VQEKVVRELLGSMTHRNVRAAALHTIAGRTEPAGVLASQHAIELSDRAELAKRARSVFSEEELNHWFKNPPRCCPKCDGRMVLRTSNFDPFWGCARYPRCRGTINTRSVKAAV
jgi:restriction system protein